MQVTTPEAITEKIVVQIIPKFMSTVPKWKNRADIQKFVRTAIGQLVDVAGIDDLGQKQLKEPQSEDEEESKEKHSFASQLAQKGKTFMNALQNLQIVQENDLAELKSGREYQLSQIDRLVKFKSNCEEPIKQVVAALSEQIASLEKQLNQNRKMADIVLLEIQAIFVSALARLETKPEIVQTQVSKFQPKTMKNQRTREVLVDTKDGYGDFHSLPSKPSFDNPIAAIHHVDDSSACLKFETKDGGIGTHPLSRHPFVRVAMKHPDTSIAMIKVWAAADRIRGIQLIGEGNEVLVNAGCTDGRKFEQIPLESGERLIGIKSRLLKNNDEDGTRHCKMVFIIGWLE